MRCDRRIKRSSRSADCSPSEVGASNADSFTPRTPELTCVEMGPVPSRTATWTHGRKQTVGLQHRAHTVLPAGPQQGRTAAAPRAPGSGARGSAGSAAAALPPAELRRAAFPVLPPPGLQLLLHLWTSSASQQSAGGSRSANWFILGRPLGDWVAQPRVS